MLGLKHGVNRLEDYDPHYAEKGGVPGHFIFGRGRDRSERTHLVHLVEFDGESWGACLAFRDALRADALLRAAYLEVKERAARLAPEGRAQYGAFKQSFIESLRFRRAVVLAAAQERSSR